MGDGGTGSANGAGPDAAFAGILPAMSAPSSPGIPAKLGSLRRLLPQVGILRGRGLARSLELGSPVDAGDRPLPWMSYPFIDYVAGLDLSGLRLFEFGCGNSTRYWATRCREVVAVESDREWHERVRASMPPNATVVLAPGEPEYLASIAGRGEFDIVVVDGALDRRKMAEAAVRHLRPDGMVVLDNSDVWVGAAALLREADLIQVDFTGFAPAVYFEQTTSVFLRPAFRPKPLGRHLPAKTPGCMGQVIE
jgi:hypothetical protein